ncbi:MAG: mechanosensitive ion channel family protein [Desulfurococcaceae archaeon]
MRKYTYILLSLVIFGIAIYVLYILLPPELRGVLEKKAIQALIILVVGISIIEYIARTIMQHAKRVGAEALLVRNIVLVLGYIVIGVTVASVLGLGGEPLIASATFSGLIIGLGMQPILSNFFAGLIILGTGFLKPGKKIKLAGPNIPLSAISFPAYKSFSRDVVIPQLRGTVVEIGLMYTKVLLDTGELIKLSNSMLFGNSIVFEEDEILESPRVQVRYEFPITFDPDMVIRKIKDSLNNLSENIEVYLEEQSDKNYYIVIVIAHTPEGVKVREFRSIILSRLIKVQKEMELEFVKK